VSGNLDLKGNIDIAVSAATNNLARLETAMVNLDKEFANGSVQQADYEKRSKSLAQAISTASRTIIALNDSQGKSVMALAKAETEANKQRIASQQAVVAAARQAAAEQEKASAAARRAATTDKYPGQSSRVFTPTAVTNQLGDTAPTQPSKTDFLIRKQAIDAIVAEDRKATERRTADSVAGYTREFQAAVALDARLEAERRRSAQQTAQYRAQQAAASNSQQIRDEQRIRQQELTAMRSQATASLGLPDAGALNQTRYALYDVSTTLGVLGASLTAAGASALVFGAQYESAFTQVERTSLPTVEQAGQLKQQLTELSQTIPVGFDQLSSIAALGAQMGIANENLEQFSDTTARYSAVTGISTDQAATSFGALFELTNTGSGDMEKLASSINFVGVQSVATDGEILSLAQNIAASTTQAGFLAEETVGLAGALASLRIQPEQARGVILRLFADFDKAANEGGDAMAKYAAVLGTTTEEAQKLWQSDASAFFDQLLKGLSTANNLNQALSDLGITETRESNVLQRLAGNYDTYAASMENASNAYQEGTFLGESYGRVADDVASRVQILVNSIQNLLAKAGQALGPVLGPVLTIVTAVVQGLESIPAPILAVLTAVTLLAGGFALIVAGGAALVASGFAIQTAMRGLGIGMGTGVAAGTALRGTITQLTGALGINTAAARVNGLTIGSLIPGYRGAQAGAAGLSVSVAASSGAFARATAGARAFGVALLATPLLNIVAALSIIVPLLFTLTNAFNASAEAAAKTGDELLQAGGGAEGFAAALKADTEDSKNLGRGLGTLTTVISDSQRASAEAADAVNAHKEAIVTATGATNENEGSTVSASSALREQTFVIGENAQAWVSNALAKQAAADADNPLNEIFADEQLKGAYQAAGIDIAQAISAGMGQDGGVEYALIQQVNAARGRIEAAVREGSVDPSVLGDLDALAPILAQVGNGADAMGQQFEVASNVAGALGTDISSVGLAGADASSAVADLAGSVGDLFDSASGASSYAADMNALRDSIDESGFSFDALTSGGTANIEALGSALESATTYGASLGLSAQDSMAQALFSIGGDTNQIIALMQSLAASNPTLYASLNIDDVLAKYQQMQSLGIGGGLSLASAQGNLDRLKQQRTKLQSQISSSGGGNSSKSAQRDADRSAKIAADNQKKLQDAIKTTAEYARDMGTAMKEAFDKRYGVQQAIDDVTTKVTDMRDRIAEANDKINSLHADLASLASDRNILEIQLGVATDYGDTTRADAIRASLGQNSIDQADKQKQLAVATAAASTQLEGNTAAAIANRAAVLGLIESYRGQIEAFAATGASADQVSAYIRTLQAQFEQQLTQLGFNQQQVRNYAGTFDILRVAVNNVPTRKEVTVTADTSQAMAGLSGVGSRIAGLQGNLSSLNAAIAAAEADVAKQQRAQPLINQVNALRDQIVAASGKEGNLNSRTNALQGQLNALLARLASGNYASGGLITGGQRPANRGVDNTMINAQFGEGVVNLKGMDYLGTDGLNAINNQQNPFPPTIVFRDSPSTTKSGTVVVELSLIDRQLIAANKNVTVSIGRDAVANAANAANFDNSQRGANG